MFGGENECFTNGPVFFSTFFKNVNFAVDGCESFTDFLYYGF